MGGEVGNMADMLKERLNAEMCPGGETWRRRGWASPRQAYSTCVVCDTLTYGRCGDYLQRLRALRRLQLQHLIRRQRQEGPVPRLTLEIPYTADGAVIFALLSRGSVKGGRMAARPRINHKWEGKIASRHVRRCTLSGE